jgi:hypothetical protein
MLKQFLFFIYVLNIIFCGNPAGVRLAVHKDIIVEFEKIILPKIFQRIGNINIDSVEKAIDLKITQAKVGLRNIQINVSEIKREDVFINYASPNSIGIEIKNIKGRGNFNVEVTAGDFDIINNNVEVIVKQMDVIFDVVLDEMPSRIHDKKRASAYLTNFRFKVDFDFEMKGLLGSALNIVKNFVKGYILVNLQKRLDERLAGFSRLYIDRILENFPVYYKFPRFGEDIAVDLSITAPFQVYQEFMVASANGAPVNIKLPETMDNKLKLPQDLPLVGDYDSKKKLQLIISEYFINSTLNTMYLSDMFTKLVTDSLIPAEYPIRLDSSSLDVIFNGLTKLYGKNTPAQIKISASEKPVAKLHDGLITLSGAASISVQVQKNGLFEQCAFISGELSVSISVSVDEKQVKLKVVNLIVPSIELKDSAVKEVNVENIKSLLNLAFKLHGPVDKTFEVKLPEMIKRVIEPETNIRNGFIEIGMDLELNENTPVDDKKVGESELSGK